MGPDVAAAPPMRPGTAALSLVHLVRDPAPRGDARPPLVVLLHGVGSNELSMAPLAPLLDPHALVIAARSPIELGPRAFAWFHVTFTPNGSVIDAAEAAAGWAHVARFVDEAVAAYDADPARVFVVGFSQGAIMGLAAMLTAPERLAGVAALSGRLLPEVLPHAAPDDALRGKPVLIVHGTDDEKLGVHLARSARETLSRWPLALEYRELPIGHTIAPAAVAEVRTWLRARLDAI